MHLYFVLNFTPRSRRPDQPILVPKTLPLRMLASISDPTLLQRPCLAFETEKYVVYHGRRRRLLEKVRSKKWPSVFCRARCKSLHLPLWERERNPGLQFLIILPISRTSKGRPWIYISAGLFTGPFGLNNAGVLASEIELDSRRRKREGGRFWPQPRSWHLLASSHNPFPSSVDPFTKQRRLNWSNCTNDVTFTFEISRPGGQA